MRFTDKINLYPHQIEAVEWMSRQSMRSPKGGILAHDMGLGKTIDVLYHISTQTDNNIGHNLIVVPNNLLKQWSEEFHSYVEDISDKDFATYTTNSRPKDIRSYRIVVTTYDTLLSDQRGDRGELLDAEWTRIFLDEAHEIRNRKSIRNKVVNYLTGETKWCLTGTPIWNSEDDLYSLKAFVHFEKPALVDKSYLHIRTKEILSLPIQTINDVDCRFTKDQLTQYKTFERKMLLATLRGEGRKKLLGNIIRLRRMCNHSDNQENVERMNNWGENIKFEKVCGIMSTIPAGEKLVVFSSWLTTLTSLKQKLEMDGHNKISMFHGEMTMEERQANLREFRDGNNNIMLITIKCGGVGLNLVCANHIVIFEPQYSPFSEKQAIDRVYRIGQRKPVFVHRLYTKFTIEHWMNSIKDWKNVIKRVQLDDSQENTEEAAENRIKMFQRYVILKPQVDRELEKMKNKAETVQSLDV
jgi:transcription termination factor 2